MEKTLILKHILGMLCLLISYSKFTRPVQRRIWKNESLCGKIAVVNATG